MNKLILLISILIPFPSWALQSFMGVYKENSRAPSIVVSSGESYRIFSLNADISDDLSRLSAGDVIYFQGYKVNPQQIHVNAIEYIEVKNLLGSWQSENWDIFTFRRGQLLITKNPISNSDPEQVYDFTIYPGQGEYWTILLSNASGSKIGQLKVENSHSEFKLLNLKTLEVQEQFHLVRVR